MEVMGMGKHRKKAPLEKLPPDVQAFVIDKLAQDWDTLAKPCREVCRGCPADRDAEDSPCDNCIFKGLSTLAGVVTLASRMAQLKKSQDNNI